MRLSAGRMAYKATCAEDKVLIRRPRRPWSPQQIGGWPRVAFANRPEMWVSYETIYGAIYVQSRGNPRAELTRSWRLARVGPRAR